ncbi:MAG: SET domain-containing protein-lysine N-methyltransferase [Betaproteobacteria bacterium]|jgi:hypothetical protein|nr:SET domain-containing protein-lysine N-methyltransferase [Betaproteobacteria bacterium]NBT69569.1 SET domain-containing protein-lysine N-methyltransferase [Betaproteobacteria bacterium]NBY07439.1 SET domain-containing protein-lysine N-methyltransferase [Betaproteobacteria bacterium]
MSQTHKEKLLDHLKNQIYCRLGVSTIHGIGVFALRDIPKGFYPLLSFTPNNDVVFKPAEIEKLPEGVKTLIDTFCYVDDQEILVPRQGFNTLHLQIYLNHSKQPNLEFDWRNNLIALRDIHEGEELTIDYDLAFEEEHLF